MTEKKHSFFGSAIFYTLGVILAQGVTFLLTQIIYPAAVLDAADLTRIGLYSMWAAVLGSLIGLEAGSSLNNARFKFGSEKLNEYTSSLLGIGMLMLGIVAALLFAFRGFFVEFAELPVDVLMASALQGFFSFCVVLIAQKCRVTNQPGQFVLWTALVCILRFAIALPLFLRLTQNQYLGDVWGSVAAYAIVGTAGIVVLIKNGRTIGNRVYWKYCLALTVPLVFHTLASQILGQSAQYILVKLVGLEQTAPYTLAYGISTIANAVWLAFNNAWSVWYFDRTQENKHDEIRDLFKKYAGFVTLLTVGVMLVAPDLVSLVGLLGKNSYPETMYLLPVLMLGCYFMFLYTFPVAYETYKHKTKYIAIGTVAAAAVNIVMNFVLIPVMGLMGSALASLIAYSMLFVFHYLIAKFLIKGFQIPFLHLLLPAVLMGGVTVLTYFTMDIMALRWVVAIAAVVAAFFVFRRSRHIMM